MNEEPWFLLFDGTSTDDATFISRTPDAIFALSHFR